jgi:signal transduction histidine kinase
LQQLFENLLTNSLKYKKAEIAPKIKILYEIISNDKIDGHKTLTADRYYKISFIDNGIGFEQEQEHKVFDLFTKLHSREYAGTGIGLTICKKVVQNHNGIIKAKSEINEGTVFEIYLPIT